MLNRYTARSVWCKIDNPDLMMAWVIHIPPIHDQCFGFKVMKGVLLILSKPFLSRSTVKANLLSFSTDQPWRLAERGGVSLVKLCLTHPSTKQKQPRATQHREQVEPHEKHLTDIESMKHHNHGMRPPAAEELLRWAIPRSLGIYSTRWSSKHTWRAQERLLGLFLRSIWQHILRSGVLHSSSFALCTTRFLEPTLSLSPSVHDDAQDRWGWVPDTRPLYMEAGKTCPGQWTHGLREVRYRDFVAMLRPSLGTLVMSEIGVDWDVLREYFIYWGFTHSPIPSNHSNHKISKLGLKGKDERDCRVPRVRVRNWGREAAHWVRPVGATRERGWAGWRKVMGRGRQFWPEKLIGFIIIFFYFCSILHFFSIFVFPSWIQIQN
jgi:hypothetical protein